MIRMNPELDNDLRTLGTNVPVFISMAIRTRENESELVNPGNHVPKVFPNTVIALETIRVKAFFNSTMDTVYPQIAINRLKHQPSVTSPIIGVRTMEQLVDNLGTLDFNLNSKDLEKLTTVSQPRLEYPYSFINNYCT